MNYCTLGRNRASGFLIVFAVLYIVCFESSETMREMVINEQRGCLTEFELAVLKTDIGPIKIDTSYYNLTKIAYLILIHDKHSLQSGMILLSTIYDTNNVYWIHLDKKMAKCFYDTFLEFVANLKNVYVEQVFDIRWGRWSMVEVELYGIQQLLKIDQRWDFVINLSGDTFPLKTNREIVTLLSRVKGYNFVTIHGLGPGTHFREVGWKRKRLPKQSCKNANCTKLTGTPHEYPVYFSTQWFTLTRNFSEYLIQHDLPKQWADFFKALDDLFPNPVQDEMYFQTVIMSSPFHKTLHPVFPILPIRFEKWRFCSYSVANGHGPPANPCYLGEPDVSVMLRSRALFARKFHLSNRLMLKMKKYLEISTAQKIDEDLFG